MNFHSSKPFAQNENKQLRQPLRLAALGDGLVGPLTHSGRGGVGRERLFIDNRFINWLRVLLPDADLAEDAVFGAVGETTVDVAKHVQEVLNLDPPPQAVLICAGTEDCMAAIKGTAPNADETADALDLMATKFSAAGIKPVFIVPPPCALFSNGLFADRFLAIAVTLRRMCAQEKPIGLIDPTKVLLKRRSYGVEPDPRYVTANADGRLSTLGAFRLAEVVADRLRSMFEQKSSRRSAAQKARGALNENPLMTGSSGAISGDAVSGHCATGYSIDAHQMGGASVWAATRLVKQDGAAQRLTFSGRYTTSWGFVRLCHNVAADVVEYLDTGDSLEAVCDFELSGPVSNIAAISLHATAVWDNDFIGLHSNQYVGGPGVSEAYDGRLRTPQFTLHGKLKSLHVSVQAHLVPGANLEADGQLDILLIMLRKVQQKTVRTAIADSKRGAALLRDGRRS